MAMFFQSYSFDLDKTVYRFYIGALRIKKQRIRSYVGALALLNEQLKRENTDVTRNHVLCDQAGSSTYTTEVLQSRALMEEIRQTCEAIQDRLARAILQLYHATG